ncbi:chondroitin proteoglycan-2-like [Ischnura elegans]|uniref:chondroitin proteoglycan-2-like n=1 Tax=Ischnura elegans TaxID=197161 RepID=UPI001ED88CD2|nr:chondroitin proteoglycan-2-like [Ischnura elegans]
MEGMEIKNVIAIIVLSLIVAASGKTARNEATPYQRFCTNANCPNYEHSSSIVANGEDCDSFCICTCDGALYMKCPEGLQYDDRTKSCDWPSVVGCGSTTHSHGPTTTPRPQGLCEKVKPKCPANNGVNATLLPNPGDCGSYCVCDWGNAIWMPCPAGLEFNPKLHVCDWPANAGCSSTGEGTTEKPGSTTRKPPTPPHGNNGCDKVQSKCPAENSGNDILMPNPDDCGSYCVCDWGNAILMPCPPGLEFNPKLMVCDWPANAGCSSDPPKTTTHDNFTPTKPQPTPGNNGCYKVQSKCPAENTGNAILLPNPDDCGSYCVCDWGKAIYMTCPAGLEFNAKLMVCDWPANAGCSSNIPTTTSHDIVTPTKPPPTGGDNGCYKVQLQCPAENTGNAILLPNPDDCGSYCVCDWGNAIYMSCPAGLEFNPKLMVCDWPANAGCSSDPVHPPTPRPVDPTGPTGRPGNNGCSKVQPKCPAENSGNATLLPNPDDCGSYCVCDWGNAIYMRCPDGLEFNPKLMVCDWPANAGCSSDPVPPPTSGPKPTSKPGNDGCPKVQPKCPAENSGNAILLPNPDDCGSYCVCDWGNAIFMSCPDGLEFNPKLMVCDWPANAGCSSDPVNPPPSSNLCVDITCPPTNGVNATLLPNPHDCSSYCVCDYGRPFVMPCPSGLEFNPSLKVCDWPKNAGCTIAS